MHIFRHNWPLLVATVLLAISICFAAVTTMIVFTVLRHQANARVALPSKDTLAPPVSQAQVFLHVNADEKIHIAGRLITLQELKDTHEITGLTRVRVRVSPRAKYQTVKKILDQLGTMGCKDIIFSVSEEVDK